MRFRGIGCLLVAAITVAGCGDDSPLQPDGGPADAEVDAPPDGPPAVERWKQVATGNLHACGIADDDRLYCWGANGRGELGDGSGLDRAAPTVVDDKTWLTIATGGSGGMCAGTSHRRTCGGHTCGIRTDGTLWCWGRNVEGQLGDGTLVDQATPVRIGSSSDWTALAAGTSFTCGIRAGQLWCWGDNGGGQLGNDSTTDSAVPVAVAGAGPWTAVAAGSFHACALDEGGALWCWGDDSAGQLGIGRPATRSLVPVQVSGGWSSVSAGAAFTFGIKSDGTLWSWGVNRNSILARPIAGDQFVPREIGGTWRSVGASRGDHVGRIFACGVTTGRELQCWGSNAHGQAGGNSPADVTMPMLVASGFDSVVAGTNHVCGLDDDSRARCWGLNRYGQVGIGTPGDTLVPRPVLTLAAFDDHRASGTTHCARVSGDQQCWGYTLAPTPAPIGTWQVLARSSASSCGIDAAGALWCWGTNQYGQLGQGDVQPRPQPTRVGTDSDWTDVSIAQSANFGMHTCGVRGGRVLCWGANTAHQVGNNGAPALAPVEVGTTADWVDVEVGDGTSCALQTGGGLSCWGYVVSGGLRHGVPTKIDDNAWTAISMGQYHRCGLHDDSVFCWGSGYYGVLGRGDTAGSLTPLQVGAAGGWSGIAAGFHLSCGVQQDGTMWCWGHHGFDGTYGVDVDNVTSPRQVGTDTGWSEISVGSIHACAVRGGGLQCWGSNGFGQLGDGTGYFSAPQLLAPR